MDGAEMHGMPEMGPPPTTVTTGRSVMGGGGMHHGHMMMHMTFFWGKNAEILFRGWPDTSSGMYALCLLFVFILSLLVEWLSHSEWVRKGSDQVSSGLVLTLVHTIRVGLAYMVMLAVMSFNAGVFLVVLAGHAVGFLVFGSNVFMRPPLPLPADKSSDLAPMICA